MLLFLKDTTVNGLNAYKEGNIFCKYFISEIRLDTSDIILDTDAQSDICRLSKTSLRKPNDRKLLKSSLSLLQHGSVPQSKSLRAEVFGIAN